MRENRPTGECLPRVQPRADSFPGPGKVRDPRRSDAKEKGRAAVGSAADAWYRMRPTAVHGSHHRRGGGSFEVESVHGPGPDCGGKATRCSDRPPSHRSNPGHRGIFEPRGVSSILAIPRQMEPPFAVAFLLADSSKHGSLFEGSLPREEPACRILVAQVNGRW